MAAHSDDFIDPDSIGVNASTEPSIGELIERRLSRRDALRAWQAWVLPPRSAARSRSPTRRPR